MENYQENERHLHTESLFVNYNVLKFDQVYDFKLLEYIHKNDYYFAIEEEQPSHRFRTAMWKMPRVRTGYGKQALNYHVEGTIGYKCSLNGFKHNIKKYVITNGILFK